MRRYNELLRAILRALLPPIVLMGGLLDTTAVKCEDIGRRTSAIDPGELRFFVGKSPFDDTMGRTLFEIPEVQSGLRTLLGEEGLLLTKQMVTSASVIEQAGWLLASGCRPDACENNQWVVAINLADSNMFICLSQSDKSVKLAASGRTLIERPPDNPCPKQQNALSFFQGLFSGPISGAGVSFEDGVAVFGRHDYAAAMRIFGPLADNGSARAAYYMGRMYDHGWGVPQSSAQAATWFRKAADQGHAPSESSLGYYYLWGDGVPRDYAEAMKWSLKAAKQGEPDAQSRLGLIYERGYGVPQDYIIAYMWFAVSAHDQDFKGGVQRDLDEIAPHLAPSQIVEAQTLAQRCLQSNYSDCDKAP
jgi:hypothetical protein